MIYYVLTHVAPKAKKIVLNMFFVESCDDFIAQENDQLKHEVKRLENEVIKLKKLAYV